MNGWEAIHQTVSTNVSHLWKCLLKNEVKGTGVSFPRGRQGGRELPAQCSLAGLDGGVGTEKRSRQHGSS